MRHQIFRLWGFLVCLLGLWITPSIAQTDLDLVFVAEDQSFEFHHPSNWEVDHTDPNFILAIGTIGSDELVIAFIGPNGVEENFGRVRTFQDVVEELDSVFALENIEEINIGNRRAVAGRLDMDGQSGRAFIIPMTDGGFGIMIATVDNVLRLRRYEDLFHAIAETFDRPRGVQLDDVSLQNYDENWRDAVAELETLGIIGSGGSLIFEEDYAFFEGEGYQFIYLGRRNPRTNFVMSAELTFEHGDGDEAEGCALFGRMPNAEGGMIEEFLAIGLSDNAIYYVDTNTNPSQFEDFPISISLRRPHHLLYIVLEDSLTIFLDGEVIASGIYVDKERGVWGFGVDNGSNGTRCEGRNIWVYEITAFEAGVCTVTAPNTVNRRTGAGTNFAQAGTLAGGEVVAAIAYADDADGYRWYQIQDESWVRSDVVRVNGDCSALPEGD